MWWLLELALIALVAAPLVWAWRQAVANARADPAEQAERAEHDRPAPPAPAPRSDAQDAG